MAIKIKIKKGDTVRVTAGSHKGKEGNILNIFHETNKAIVGGVNMVKKHTLSAIVVHQLKNKTSQQRERKSLRDLNIGEQCLRQWV